MRTRWNSTLELVDTCWIGLTIAPAAITTATDTALRDLGLTPLPSSKNCYILKTPANWSIPWRNIFSCLSGLKLVANTQVSVIVGGEEPTAQEISFHHKAVQETNILSRCMWLFEAISDKRVTCLFQPVIDRRGNIYGHESLVRATRDDGSQANGGEIFYASKILRVERLMDRYLHEMAIQKYMQQNLSGFLFINLIPGFIQRPEFYLEELSKAVSHFKMNPKQIVIDCTNSEHPGDIQHLKSIHKYCQSRGYMMSLDDIESVHSARRILNEISPDFIKLDMKLVQKILEDDAKDTVRQLVALAEQSASAVIAEGVETEAMREALMGVGVNLFQGYLFSPPPQTQPALQEKPVPAKKSVATAGKPSKKLH